MEFPAQPFTIGDDQKSITCHLCGLTSHHPKDVEHRYCGKCGVFLGEHWTEDLRKLFILRYVMELDKLTTKYNREYFRKSWRRLKYQNAGAALLNLVLVIWNSFDYVTGRKGWIALVCVAVGGFCVYWSSWAMLGCRHREKESS